MSLWFTVACNSAMGDGVNNGTLKADMPNTMTISNGEVVYDLSGEWNITTNVSHHFTFIVVV